MNVGRRGYVFGSVFRFFGAQLLPACFHRGLGGRVDVYLLQFGAPLRIKQLVESKCTRHVSQQLIEDSFNSIKTTVDKRSNTVATPAFAMGTLIDRNVLATKYQFTEVERVPSLGARNVTFSPDTWTPVLAKNKLPDALQKANFSSVVSYGDPDWFSPGASGYLGPLADLEVARQADRRNQLHLLGQRNYCRLVNKGLLIKRADSDIDKWFIGVGSCDGTIAIGWPATRTEDGHYLPDLTSSRELIAVLDVDEWLAQPVEWVSPLHRAAKVEMGKVGLASDLSEVFLKASHEYGALKICAKAVGPPRRLWEAAAWHGFWSLPQNYLRELALRREIELTDTTLLSTLEALYKNAFPGCSRDDIIAMLDRRGVAFEDSMQSVDDLLAMEDLCDSFDKGFSEQLLEECKEARKIESNWEDFTNELVRYKVLRDSLLLFSM